MLIILMFHKNIIQVSKAGGSGLLELENTGTQVIEVGLQDSVGDMQQNVAETQVSAEGGMLIDLSRGTKQLTQFLSALNSTDFSEPLNAPNDTEPVIEILFSGSTTDQHFQEEVTQCYF